MKTCFVTNCYWVNLRSTPNSNSPNTVITALAANHECTLIDDSGGWWKVKTEVDNRPLEGYIRSTYLTLVKEDLPFVDTVSRSHLSENRAFITPNYDGGRAHPIGDGQRVRRDLSTTESKVNSIHQIISYLDVESSVRYQKKGSITYCNIYAYDFCYLCGVFIPRVWWSGPSLIKLSNGESVPIQYGDTVKEVRANELFHWMKDFGPTFGWRRVFDVEELQVSANNGGVGVIVANTKDHTRAGHVCVVVPQTDEHLPVMTSNKVTTPVMSQAGSNNYNYWSYKWWTNSKYSFFGFWVND